MLVYSAFARSLGVPNTVRKRRIFSLEVTGLQTKYPKRFAAGEFQRFTYEHRMFSLYVKLRCEAMPDLDPYNGRPVFFDCVSCGGKNGRSRKSPGSSNCMHDSCKGVRKRRHEELEAVAAPALRAATTSCFKVKELLGISVCLELDADERRVGREADDDDIALQIRGGFGKGAHEDESDLIPDTRWVQWSELVDNDVDDDALDKLERLAKTLPKLLKAARKRIRERAASDDA